MRGDSLRDRMPSWASATSTTSGACGLTTIGSCSSVGLVSPRGAGCSRCRDFCGIPKPAEDFSEGSNLPLGTWCAEHVKLKRNDHPKKLRRAKPPSQGVGAHARRACARRTWPQTRTTRQRPARPNALASAHRQGAPTDTPRSRLSAMRIVPDGKRRTMPSTIGHHKMATTSTPAHTPKAHTAPP